MSNVLRLHNLLSLQDANHITWHMVKGRDNASMRLCEPKQGGIIPALTFGTNVVAYLALLYTYFSVNAD